MKVIKPIKTEADYDAVLAEIDTLMAAEPSTPEGDRLDILVTLVEAYEAKHWHISPPDPITAIELRMQQKGLTRRQRKMNGNKCQRPDRNEARYCNGMQFSGNSSERAVTREGHVRLLDTSHRTPDRLPTHLVDLAPNIRQYVGCATVVPQHLK